MVSFALELESLRDKIERDFPDHPPLYGPVPTISLSLQGYDKNNDINELFNAAFEDSFDKFKTFEKLLK